MSIKELYDINYIIVQLCKKSIAGSNNANNSKQNALKIQEYAKVSIKSTEKVYKETENNIINP